MKKAALLFVLLSISFAQLQYTEFRLGKLSPKGTESGFYGSLSTGKMFDANLGYALELGYFGKRFTKEREVGTYSTENSEIETKQVLLTTSTTMIPVMAKLNLIKELTNTLLLKADLGLGYNFFWDSYDNKVDKISDTKFFSGLIWQLGADVGIQISEKGSVFGGLFYNGGTVTNSDEVDGLPTYDEIRTNGLGFRLTIRIDGLGF